MCIFQSVTEDRKKQKCSYAKGGFMFFPETSHLENVIKFLEAIWWLLRIDHDTELFERPRPLEALPVFSNSSTKYLSFL